MPRIKKALPKTHVVLVDTNVLWHEYKSHPVAPEFDRLWDGTRAVMEMELVVPQVVYEELLFQQTTSASKSLERATKAFAEVSAVAARPFTHRLTAPRLKQHIKRKLDRWLADRSAIVQPVPSAAISWERLIERALWREPPFTYDPKAADSERGFRDALIMETVVDFCRRETRDVILVFLCRDNLLRATTQKELHDDKRCLFHESLQEFTSYVKLTQEKLTEQFIRLILPRATEKFYHKDDPACLYLRDAIGDQLWAKCVGYVSNPQTAAPTTTNPLVDLLTGGPRPQDSNTWQPEGAGRFWITAAEFSEIEGGRAYHWVSEVTYIGLYRRQDPSGSAWLAPLISGEDQERALIIRFRVLWRARVTADGRFHDMAVEGIEPGTPSFAPPTQEQVRAYGLGSHGT